MGCGGCRGCDYNVEELVLQVAEEEKEITSAGQEEKAQEVIERAVQEEEEILNQGR